MAITSVSTDPCRDGHSECCEHQDQIQAAEEEFGTSLKPEPVGNGSARLNQVGGGHYKKFKIQPWDVIDEYGLGFYAGNALKYLLRAGNKGPMVEDLKKCRHYIDKLIEKMEEEG